MKRLLLAAVLLLIAPLALAQRSDVLLDGKGTMYSAAVEWSFEHPEVGSASSTYVVITVREAGSEPRRVIVPGTLTIGSHSNPALAFDNESGSLFVFWQYMPNMMASELRFTSLSADGTWSEPTAFEGANYRIRRNARIAVTRKAYDKNEETGELTLVPEVNVHAVWWEDTGAGERAEYAMLTIKNGGVAVHTYDLSSLIEHREPVTDVHEDLNRELYRYPAIYESPKSDSVEVLFGDVNTLSFKRVSFKPIGNARVRIPGGIADKGFDGKADLAFKSSGPVEVISPAGDNALFYFENEGRISYLLHNDEGWSALRTLPEGLSRDMALDALRRLVGAH